MTKIVFFEKIIVTDINIRIMRELGGENSNSIIVGWAHLSYFN